MSVEGIKVMLVDDEPNVLSGYRRNLRKRFDLTTCCGGAEALETAANEGPFAVVVSDMRMPEMTGVEFLSRLKVAAPTTVRMMLTGNSDQQTAIDAVNEGDVFRFMNKPCSPESMSAALDAGIKQYRLLNAEKELLEQTVRGSIAALVEVLALAKPEVFGRLDRLQKWMLQAAPAMALELDWAVSTLPLVSLLGTVALPDDLVTRALAGGTLAPEDQRAFDGHANLGASLLAKIPRMETLAELVRAQSAGTDDMPAATRLLRVVLAYDALEQSGLEPAEALSRLEAQQGLDAPALNAFRTVIDAASAETIKEVALGELNSDMALADDVVTTAGALLMARGQRLTESVVERLKGFRSKGAIGDRVLVRCADG
ncbi:MAG: response regulator [Pseudomonadota bacterium]